MALGIYFTPSSVTPAQYDDAISRLEAAGAGALLPIIGALGADPGQPHISPVHNIIKG